MAVKVYSRKCDEVFVVAVKKCGVIDFLGTYFNASEGVVVVVVFIDAYESIQIVNINLL